MKVVYEVSLPDGMEIYNGEVSVALPHNFGVRSFPKAFGPPIYKRFNSVGTLSLKKSESASLEFDVAYFDKPVEQGRLKNFIDSDTPDGTESLENGFIPNETLRQILRNLEILDSSNNPIRKFDQDVALEIFRYFRDNFRYVGHGNDRTFEDFINNREGDCKDFSESFAQMIYLAGGMSRIISQSIFCKRPLWGRTVCSVSKLEADSHRFTLVSFDREKWEIVDPTIYITSPTGIEGRAVDMSPYVFFDSDSANVELAGHLTNDLTSNGKLTSLIDDQKPERTLENYHGKECKVSVSFPDEPKDASPPAYRKPADAKRL